MRASNELKSNLDQQTTAVREVKSEIDGMRLELVREIRDMKVSLQKSLGGMEQSMTTLVQTMTATVKEINKKEPSQNNSP